MFDSGVGVAVVGLLACDPDVADAAGLAEMSRRSACLRAFADDVDVRINRRSNQLATENAADTGVHVLLDEGRLTGREVQATGGRDRVCGEMPQFDDALATGACTAGHVDALAKHTKVDGRRQHSAGSGGQDPQFGTHGPTLRPVVTARLR